jgi:hypothetical protein
MAIIVIGLGMINLALRVAIGITFLRGLTDVSTCLVMVTSMIPGLMSVALRTHHVRQY